MAIYRGLEAQFFRTVFHPIHECMFGLSFLTTLNIYKDYFKGHKRWHKLHKSRFHKCEEECDWKPSLPYFLKKLLCLYIIGFCDQATLWSSSRDELKNFATNILLKLVILGSTHLLVSHVLGAVHWKGEIVTTKQVQLSIGVRV